MKTQLAQRLLIDSMQWAVEEATEELDWLKLMVESKFDHYQGYGPGDRFYLNLIYWLGQFQTNDERREAYKFLRKNMVFVSQREMHHLIALSYRIIKQQMRAAVAVECGLKPHQTWASPEAKRRLTLLERRTLYVALSDGARIDVFRRLNEGVVSNEQVVASSEITKKKWDDLVGKLRKRLDEEGMTSEPAKFERICLIDDFTGSGSTLIREEKTGDWDGKVVKFCERNRDYVDSHFYSEAVIHLHHYLASSRAHGNVLDEIKRYGEAAAHEFHFRATFSNTLRPEVVIGDASDPPLVALLEKYYDPTCESKPLGKDVWFGYKQCGLPLVLDHNTPNNSIALLWASGQDPSLMRPLFPRKQRHSDNGQSIQKAGD